jgi:hypothetical protein
MPRLSIVLIVPMWKSGVDLPHVVPAAPGIGDVGVMLSPEFPEAPTATTRRLTRKPQRISPDRETTNAVSLFLSPYNFVRTLIEHKHNHGCVGITKGLDWEGVQACTAHAREIPQRHETSSERTIFKANDS